MVVHGLPVVVISQGRVCVQNGKVSEWGCVSVCGLVGGSMRVEQVTSVIVVSGSRLRVVSLISTLASLLLL